MSTIDGLQITSTSPRVFVDNVLSRLFESGAIPPQLFEDLMGHAIKVSRANYQRFSFNGNTKAIIAKIQRGIK
jgi:hypothetical protein